MFSHSKRAQTGTVLITGLILLVMIMLLGLAAMRTVSLQERLAGSSSDYNQAFQSAEAALRAGEAAVKTVGFIRSKAHYDFEKTPAPSAKNLARGWDFWSVASNWSKQPTTVPLYGAASANNPRYIIEYEGERPPRSIKGGLPDAGPQIYKVIALGRGMQTESGSPTSDVVLQSTIIR